MRTAPARRTPFGVALAAALVLLVVALLLSLLVGTRVLSLPETFAGLTGTDRVASAVIWELRLPRTLLGLLVGAALGSAGVLAQAVTRNPLADPGLLGISSGAAVAIVVGGALFGIGGGVPQVLVAILGAAAATVAVYAFAQRSPEGLTPVNMTLAGMAITACLGAVVSTIVLLDASTMDQYRFWVVGALGNRDADVLVPAAVVILAGVGVALVVSGSLNALALGDDTAAGLGVHVQRTRALGGVAVVLLSGTAVALSGPIVFVGLIVPHAARLLVGSDVRRALAMSALLGPLLLLTADVIGRVIARPSEVQVGVVTAILGTPLFVWLTRRARTEGGGT
ncbi:FecCD family ABC transporter permease [Nocardioides sp. NPDC101246]|uniref:FecCD family ABC transporter permease n=1 Tax=Nocardioides sp. NPDC101246 TaxID=3364336 RepID=UPI00382E6033